MHISLNLFFFFMVFVIYLLVCSYNVLKVNGFFINSFLYIYLDCLKIFNINVLFLNNLNLINFLALKKRAYEIFDVNPMWVEDLDIFEIITISYILLPGVFLFLWGLFVLAFLRRHILIYLMAIELMLLGISLIFLTFSLYWVDPCGDVVVVLILCVAAAEVVIALALCVSIYRNDAKRSISISDLVKLRY